MIKFGPSGNDSEFYNDGFVHTEQSAEWLKNKGLDCFEYSFGRGVKMTSEKAYSIRSAFEAAEVELSVHAPYYVNFANTDPEMIEKSILYVIQSAKKAEEMGAKRVVFHPAAQGKLERKDAVALAAANILRLTESIYKNGCEKMVFCPETMGKSAQIGTLSEIAEFCKTDACFLPAVDFGHINARENGSLKTENDYLERLNFLISEIGYGKTADMHVHFSKIKYTEKGEVKHLTFDDEVYGPEFAPLAVCLKRLNLQPHIVCESDGTQARDALTMKEIYRNCQNG